MHNAKYHLSECFQYSLSKNTYLCDICYVRFNKSNQNYWIVVTPYIDTKKECCWCKSDKRQKAYKSGKILFEFFDDKNVLIKSLYSGQSWQGIKYTTIIETILE